MLRSIPVSTPMLERLVDEAAGPLNGLKLRLALRLGGANPARDGESDQLSFWLRSSFETDAPFSASSSI